MNNPLCGNTFGHTVQVRLDIVLAGLLLKWEEGKVLVVRLGWDHASCMLV